MPITTNYRIEPALLRKIEKIAKQENTTENNVINDVIKKGLKTRKQETNTTENKLRFKDLIGRYTTDEPFSAVEEKRKMRRGEL
jgi:predicted transcriptional regulator